MLPDADGIGFHFGNVATHLTFCQREPGNFSPRQSGQVLGLLLFGAEQPERLRHTDRLGRGQQDGQRGIDTPAQSRQPLIFRLSEFLPPESFGNLDAERPELRQRLQERLRQFLFPIHPFRIHG